MCSPPYFCQAASIRLTQTLHVLLLSSCSLRLAPGRDVRICFISIMIRKPQHTPAAGSYARIGISARSACPLTPPVTP